MSYGFNFTVPADADPADALRAAYEGPAFGIEANASPLEGQRQNGVESEFLDAMANLMSAITGLTSAVGAASAHRITVSGHCNPGHLPREGWADDFLHVAVAQVHPLQTEEN